MSYPFLRNMDLERKRFYPKSAVIIPHVYMLYLLPTHKVNRSPALSFSFACTQTKVSLHPLFRLGAGKRIKMCERSGFSIRREEE